MSPGRSYWENFSLMTEGWAMPLSLFHSHPNQPKVNSPQSSLQGTNEVTRVNCTVCVNCSSVSDSKHTGGSAPSMAVGFFMDANMKHPSFIPFLWTLRQCTIGEELHLTDWEKSLNIQMRVQWFFPRPFMRKGQQSISSAGMIFCRQTQMNSQRWHLCLA